MIYFISGHRELSEEDFEKYYIPKIDKVLESDLNCIFVVGDYYGVDIKAQKYIVNSGFADRVIVYHMYNEPRNIAEGIIHTVSGFTTDEERDSAMTKDSDFDIAFYDHKPSGTEENIIRRHYLKFKPRKIK